MQKISLFTSTLVARYLKSAAIDSEQARCKFTDVTLRRRKHQWTNRGIESRRPHSSHPILKRAYSANRSYVALPGGKVKFLLLSLRRALFSSFFAV
ncbi:hypothetical protein SAY86_011331 [Trapa natans]|uniref:Uncharacterized protein n=1 Tax=Trapa natans TaxID=22666 RepID=A0AAN7LG76_TRANT|nr:hypothetical protein SAY86_011331 [Trapa natans]